MQRHDRNGQMPHVHVTVEIPLNAVALIELLQHLPVLAV
jgi:hypothetical protein